MSLNILIALVFLVLLYGLISNICRKQLDLNGQSLMEKSSTDSLRGFCIIMIAFSHICQYADGLKNLIIGSEVSYYIIFSWGAVGVCLFFYLSGYGCYLSLLQKDNQIGLWLIRKICKLFVHFCFAFVIVIIINSLFLGYDLDIYNIFLNFITLRLPGCTVWYLKIQLFFYLILAISMKICNRRAWMIVVLISLCYSVVAKYTLNLPNFWWKTSMSFSAGCIVANYRNFINNFLSNILVRLFVVLIGTISYILSLKDVCYCLYIQLPAYVMIAITISILWGWFEKNNKVFFAFGRISFDLYLIHIGIVESMFLLNLDIDFEIILFVLISLALAIINYYLSEMVYSFCRRKKNKAI